MPSLRQKLAARRTVLVQNITTVSPLRAENVTLDDRNPETGIWTGTTSSGSRVSMKKLGINSPYGLELPAITVQDGVGRYSS